jgi:sulfide:quinone oxidoreductase
MGTTKTWVMLGERTSGEVSYERVAALRKRGIEYVQAEIRRIYAAKREEETSRGVWRGDYLVIALGADMDMGLVPGLPEVAHTFYTLEGAVRLRDALQERNIAFHPQRRAKAVDGGRRLTQTLHGHTPR